MKATGAEIKDFWSNYWPYNLEDWYYEPCDGGYIDDEEGNFILEVDKFYDTDDFGDLIWQGPEKCPCPEKDGYMTFSRAFKRYKKISGRFICSLSVPKTDKGILEEIVKNHSGWSML